jgi:hypothetical protein
MSMVYPNNSRGEDDFEKLADLPVFSPVRRELKSQLSSAVLRMFSSRSKDDYGVPHRKKTLTCGQLADVFRRLDRDGNGELALDEFIPIISKLKLNVSEEFATR